MLRSLKSLERYIVRATDGDIGMVDDLLLDDERWNIRYLVVQTDSPFFTPGRRVLISPISLRAVDAANLRFHVSLTREQVRSSPGIDVDQPVCRQHEMDYSLYYGYPSYWGYQGMWGMEPSPGLLAHVPAVSAPPPASSKPADIHLRSVSEVRGYHLEGSDGAIGHVQDFIADEETWAVRYLVVETSNWWVGAKVLISPQWVTRISWEKREVFVDLHRQTIQESPVWNGDPVLERIYEARLHDYYRRPVYWGGLDQAPRVPDQNVISHSG